MKQQSDTNKYQPKTTIIEQSMGTSHCHIHEAIHTFSSIFQRKNFLSSQLGEMTNQDDACQSKEHCMNIEQKRRKSHKIRVNATQDFHNRLQNCLKNIEN